MTCVAVLALLLGSVIGLAAPAMAAEQQPFTFSNHVGTAIRRSDRVCLNIHNSTLTVGDRVLLISTSVTQTFVEARIIARAPDECRDTTDVDADPARYTLQVVKGRFAGSMPAIAVFGSKAKLKRNGKYISGDIDGDSQAEYFRSCGSAEGLHLTVWSGPPLQGTLRWHHYYYLGYNIEPNCTEEEVGKVKEQ